MPNRYAKRSSLFPVTLSWWGKNISRGAALLETLDTGLPLLKKEVAESRLARTGRAVPPPSWHARRLLFFCTGVTGSWGREGTRAWISACETTEGTAEALQRSGTVEPFAGFLKQLLILQRTRAVLHGAFDLSWLLASEEECRLSLLLFLQCTTANGCNRRTGPGAVAYCCSFFTCLFWALPCPTSHRIPGKLDFMARQLRLHLLRGEAAPTHCQRLAPVAPRKAGLRIPAVALARAWCRVPSTWRWLQDSWLWLCHPCHQSMVIYSSTRPYLSPRWTGAGKGCCRSPCSLAEEMESSPAARAETAMEVPAAAAPRAMPATAAATAYSKRTSQIASRSLGGRRGHHCGVAHPWWFSHGAHAPRRPHPPSVR